MTGMAYLTQVGATLKFTKFLLKDLKRKETVFGVSCDWYEMKQEIEMTVMEMTSTSRVTTESCHTKLVDNQKYIKNVRSKLGELESRFSDREGLQSFFRYAELGQILKASTETTSEITVFGELQKNTTVETIATVSIKNEPIPDAVFEIPKVYSVNR